ncbi:ATP-binding cassette domain-containing protein [Patulibacter sp. S7RM1-6]
MRDDVDLAVAPGVLHGVIGPNGAGKSSFMDALSGRRASSARTMPAVSAASRMPISA